MMTPTDSVVFPVDLETLLQPISAREPVGEWLRYEGTYDAVQEARRAEDESLPKGIWQSKVKRADFIKVDNLCQQALRERTKDLQIAVWLAEAWLVRYGLVGFSVGLRLCRELLTRFWDSAYPVLDDGDAAYRLAPLEFLDRKVAPRLKQIPLTAPIEAGEQRPALTFVDWERALHNEKTGQAPGSDEVQPSQFLAAAALTPSALYVRLHKDLSTLDREAAALEATVSERAGDHARTLRGLRTLITDILVLIGQYTPASALAEANPEGGEGGEEGAVPPASDAAAAGGPGKAGQTAGDKGGSGMERARAESEGGGGPIRSRSEAYERLAEAADYLLRTEPHSPVPYLVKRAVSWGHMNLLQLMTELVNTETDRYAIFTLLGIKPPPQQQ